MRSVSGFTFAAALVLVCLEVVRGVPQPYKLLRKGTADGVSPTASTIIAALSAVWLFYAVTNRAWASAASGLVALVFCTGTAVVVGRLTSARRSLMTALVAGVTLAAIVAVGAFLGLRDELMSVIIVGGTVAYGLPRVVAGLRSESLAGVSMLYLGLNVADALAFGVYGAAIGLWTYVGYAIIQTISCLPVMIRWWLNPHLR